MQNLLNLRNYKLFYLILLFSIIGCDFELPFPFNAPEDCNYICRELTGAEKSIIQMNLSDTVFLKKNDTDTIFYLACTEGFEDSVMFRQYDKYCENHYYYKRYYQKSIELGSNIPVTDTSNLTLSISIYTKRPNEGEEAAFELDSKSTSGNYLEPRRYRYVAKPNSQNIYQQEEGYYSNIFNIKRFDEFIINGVAFTNISLFTFDDPEKETRQNLVDSIYYSPKNGIVQLKLGEIKYSFYRKTSGTRY